MKLVIAPTYRWFDEWRRRHRLNVKEYHYCSRLDDVYGWSLDTSVLILDGPWEQASAWTWDAIRYARERYPESGIRHVAFDEKVTA